MNSLIKKYRSNGKLLISGEYLVLNGAKAFAVPVNLGQTLEVCENKLNLIDWVTFEKNTPVFTASFSIGDFKIKETNNKEKANYIKTVLLAAQNLNPDFLSNKTGYSIKAKIEFDMNWGLGTSSTLINNIAQWAKVNAFDLNSKFSKGSGYDIACAQQTKPLTYQLNEQNREIKTIDYSPPFLNRLHVLHLNKKEATEKNILNVELNEDSLQNEIKQISDLTYKFIACDKLPDFQDLINEHESIIASITKRTKVKEQHFSDFNGEIKSLGAWGGDFVLIASDLPVIEQQSYFTKKGFSTFFPLINLLPKNYE